MGRRRNRGFAELVEIVVAACALCMLCVACSDVSGEGAAPNVRVSDSRISSEQAAEGSAAQETEEGSVDSYSSYEQQSAEYARRYAGEFETHEVDGKDVFVHVPREVASGGAEVPLVLFMCGTGGNPRGDAVWSGWVEEADDQGFVLVTPDYEDYATYGETGFLADVIDWAEGELPVDAARVYSVGFSNGGAISVAMANDYPGRIAAISAAGWMVPLRKTTGHAMPFQVIQGSGEFTEETANGSVQVMDGERAAIRSLMLRDGLIGESQEADYDATPYWGYEPNSASLEEAGGFTWEYSNYSKDGYANPFAQLVVASDDVHHPRPDEARIAWEFLRHFSRVGDKVI